MIRTVNKENSVETRMSLSLLLIFSMGLDQTQHCLQVWGAVQEEQQVLSLATWQAALCGMNNEMNLHIPSFTVRDARLQT